MCFILIFITLIKNVDVNSYTADLPEIDGIIEEVWLQSDSLSDFVQMQPFEKSKPSEQTVVYLLQDDENLYVAFRCYAHNHKIMALLGNCEEDEDHVTLFLDSFNNKTSAYYFTVTASGRFYDGKLTDDGLSTDESWDGIWYYGAKIYRNRYEIEFKIPFKSIHYNKEALTWGINFKRFIATKQEIVYWNEVTEKRGLRISDFGALNHIVPKSSGYYFEFYPEGILRYDQDNEGKKITPNLTANFTWDLTSQITLLATINPDFAHIEADPYTLNLTRYPIRLYERRPFFVEGSDIFQLSSGGIINPLEVYYSRMVGKPVLNSPVPILGALQFVNKKKNCDFGVLCAAIDSFETEMSRYFGVVRLQGRLKKRSKIGIITVGTLTQQQDYNAAGAFDVFHNFGDNSVAIQSALSVKNAKWGWASSAGSKIFFGKFLTTTKFEIYSDSLDVSETGYIPYSGLKRLSIALGPWLYLKKSIRTLYIASEVDIEKNPGEELWSKSICLIVNPYFRNNWGFYSTIAVGDYCNDALTYLFRRFSLSIWGRRAMYATNIITVNEYSYNWNQQYLAYQSRNSWILFYNPIPRLTLSFSSNCWIEWDTLNSIEAITLRFRPRIDIHLLKNLDFALLNEAIWINPEQNYNDTELVSNMFGALISWNIRPKSWIYVAFNDYRAENEHGSLHLKNRIGAIKIKYFLYF